MPAPTFTHLPFVDSSFTQHPRSVARRRGLAFLTVRWGRVGRTVLPIGALFTALLSVFGTLGLFSPVGSMILAVVSILLFYLWCLGTTRQLQKARCRYEEQKRWFHEMTSNVPGILYQWYERTNGERGFSYVSPQAKHLFGVEPEQLIEDYRVVDVHPEDQPRWAESIRIAVETQQEWFFEGRVKSPARGERWIRAQSTPVEVSRDEILFDGIVMDITEERAREQVLRDQRALLRNLFDHLPDLVLVQGADGRIVDCNQAFCAFVDKPYHLVAGVLPSESGGPGLQVLDEPRSDRICEEIPIPDSSGADRLLLVCWSQLDDHGNQWMGIARDITQRKATEQTLQRIRWAVESASDGIAVLSPEGGPLHFNRACCTALGFRSPEEITSVGGLRIAFVHRGEASAFYDALAQAQPWAGEVTFRKTTSEELTVALRGDAIRDGSGQSIGYLAVWRDITERKQAETEHKEALRAAEAANLALADSHRQLEAAIGRAQLLAAEAGVANQAKSEFLATVSHEIRTPMNAVLGMATMLEDTRLDEEQREYLTTIRTSSEALLNILNDILDFSKIEAGQIELEAIPFGLVEVIEATLELFGTKAAEKSIDLLCSIAPEVPEKLQGDPTRLRQILVNLFGNALKFTTTGHVQLVVTAEAPRTEGGDERRCRLRFAVEDTGIGIPEDRKERLFQPFTQVDSSTTRRFGGTGLGLAICRRLTELMGGGIEVESTEGKGSTFTFEVDVALDQESAPAGDISCAQSVVLFLRSSRQTDLIGESLRRWGGRVYVVETLEEVGTTSERVTPDIILADLDHPDFQELTPEAADRAIKAWHHDGVLLTSENSRALRETAARLELPQILPKPIKESRLATEFVQLCRACTGNETPGPETAAVLLEQASLKVLLVEDDPVNQTVARHLLRRLEVAAEVVANGKEALAQTEATAYDLILMDMHMPVMDGLEATAAIRERDGPGTYIAAMTAAASKDDRKRCLEAGMNAFLAKPISFEALTQVVQEAVRQAQTSGSLPQETS